ncbi:MAG: hypothetical protein WAW10_07555 [Gallionella sp.]
MVLKIRVEIQSKTPILDGLKEGDAIRFELGKNKPEKLVWVIVKITCK